MVKNKKFRVKAQGGSMFPILQDGDTIEYIQIPFHKVQLNDIVLVYSNTILVTHRVIYKTKRSCITRGDNNKSADAAVQKGRVLGRVVRFQRGGRWYGIQDVYLAQSAIYLHEIQKLETLLAMQNIPHVFLKGVLVSLRYENAIPKRIYADCDVLVRRADHIKIGEAFKALGYKLQERALWQPRRLPRLNDKPEVSFSRLISGIPVVFDVHFEPVFLMTQLGGMNMLYPSNLLVKLGDKIIQDGEVKKIKGVTYSLCSVPDQILYLALHIFHHNFTDSMRYQLLDAVVHKNITQNTWRELSDTIREYKLQGYVYGVFVILKKYFHTPIPAFFFRSIRPSHFKFQVLCSIESYVDIFSQDNRVRSGTVRFLLIFLLSPKSFIQKMFIFLHKEVLFTGFKLASSFLSINKK